MSDTLPDRLADCSPGTRLVYLSVVRIQPATTSDLASETFLTETTVRRALSELRDLGAVQPLSARDGRRRLWVTAERARTALGTQG